MAEGEPGTNPVAQQMEDKGQEPQMSFMAQLMASDNEDEEEDLDVSDNNAAPYNNNNSGICQWQNPNYMYQFDPSGCPTSVQSPTTPQNIPAPFFNGNDPSRVPVPVSQPNMHPPFYPPHMYGGGGFLKQEFMDYPYPPFSPFYASPRMPPANIMGSRSSSDIFPDVSTLPKQETSCEIINLCQGKTLEERYLNNQFDPTYFSKYLLNKGQPNPVAMTEMEAAPQNITEATNRYIDYLLMENHKKLNEIVYPLAQLNAEKLELERKKFLDAVDAALAERKGFFPTQKFLGWIKLFGLEISVNSAGTYFMYKSGPPATLKPMVPVKKQGRKRSKAQSAAGKLNDPDGKGSQDGKTTKTGRKRGRPPKRRPIMAYESPDEDEVPPKKQEPETEPSDNKPKVSESEFAEMPCEPPPITKTEKPMEKPNMIMPNPGFNPAWSYDGPGYPPYPYSSAPAGFANMENMPHVSMAAQQPFQENPIYHQYYQCHMSAGMETSQSFEDADSENTDVMEDERCNLKNGFLLDLDNQ